MTGKMVPDRPRSGLRLLAVLAVASWVSYLGVALGGQSLHEEGPGGHSLLTILTLFAFAFGCYLAALRTAVRARQDGWLLALIVGAAVAFRVTLLFSDPIEEIDIYRYLWDGRVALAGISPFRYSPAQVLAAPSSVELPPDLERLVAIRDRSLAMKAILRRIHFGELTTIYPPVSQLVFALAALTTRDDASVPMRMTVIKAWFVAFDLATLGLVVALLRLAGHPVGWSLAYGWCPLVIKEVANSGHLDALAVFLTTLALYLAVLTLFRRAEGASDAAVRSPSGLIATAAGETLALAVGAKIYPIILAPLLMLSFVRRLGWRVTLGPLAAFGLTTALVLWPMWPGRRDNAPIVGAREPMRGDDQPPLPPMESFSEPPTPETGLTAFASEWEMNDFLFLLVMENLRPYAQVPPHERAWFSVVPERWRDVLIASVRSRLAIEPWRVPFFLSRALTSAIFVILAGWFAWRAKDAVEATDWLRAAFLTVAWFWLFLPTLNPWYWTWALPLLPFARSRAWLALSGLAFAYYLRFWLTYHFAVTPVLGTRYPGPWFFDYVVTWLEFGPWFVWLGLAIRPRRG